MPTSSQALGQLRSFDLGDDMFSFLQRSYLQQGDDLDILQMANAPCWLPEESVHVSRRDTVTATRQTLDERPRTPMTPLSSKSPGPLAPPCSPPTPSGHPHAMWPDNDTTKRQTGLSNKPDRRKRLSFKEMKAKFGFENDMTEKSWEAGEQAGLFDDFYQPSPASDERTGDIEELGKDKIYQHESYRSTAPLQRPPPPLPTFLSRGPQRALKKRTQQGAPPTLSNDNLASSVGRWLHGAGVGESFSSGEPSAGAYGVLSINKYNGRHEWILEDKLPLANNHAGLRGSLRKKSISKDKTQALPSGLWVSPYDRINNARDQQERDRKQRVPASMLDLTLRCGKSLSLSDVFKVRGDAIHPPRNSSYVNSCFPRVNTYGTVGFASNAGGFPFDLEVTHPYLDDEVTRDARLLPTPASSQRIVLNMPTAVTSGTPSEGVGRNSAEERVGGSKSEKAEWNNTSETQVGQGDLASPTMQLQGVVASDSAHEEDADTNIAREKQQNKRRLGGITFMPCAKEEGRKEKKPLVPLNLNLHGIPKKINVDLPVEQSYSRRLQRSGSLHHRGSFYWLGNETDSSDDDSEKTKDSERQDVISETADQVDTDVSADSKRQDEIPECVGEAEFDAPAADIKRLDGIPESVGDAASNIPADNARQCVIPESVGGADFEVPEERQRRGVIPQCVGETASRNGDGDPPRDDGAPGGEENVMTSSLHGLSRVTLETTNTEFQPDHTVEDLSPHKNRVTEDISSNTAVRDQDEPTNKGNCQDAETLGDIAKSNRDKLQNLDLVELEACIDKEREKELEEGAAPGDGACGVDGTTAREEEPAIGGGPSLFYNPVVPPRFSISATRSSSPTSSHKDFPPIRAFSANRLLRRFGPTTLRMREELPPPDSTKLCFQSSIPDCSHEEILQCLESAFPAIRVASLQYDPIHLQDYRDPQFRTRFKCMWVFRLLDPSHVNDLLLGSFRLRGQRMHIRRADDVYAEEQRAYLLCLEMLRRGLDMNEGHGVKGPACTGRNRNIYRATERKQVGGHGYKKVDRGVATKSRPTIF